MFSRHHSRRGQRLFIHWVALSLLTTREDNNQGRVLRVYEICFSPLTAEEDIGEDQGPAHSRVDPESNVLEAVS